jgi:hypothetical protein
MKKIISGLLLIFTVTTYSQITVSIGNDRVVQKNDTVTLTANVETIGYKKTLLDSIIEEKIPIVLLDTALISSNNGEYRDVVFIRDVVHGYSPNQIAILIQSPNDESHYMIRSEVLDNGNYTRHSVTLTNGIDGNFNLEGYYFDYQVNPPDINTIKPGDYILFLTNRYDEWSLITGITVEDDVFSNTIYYIWNTGDTTQSIQVVPENDTLFSVEVSKRGKNSKDNVIIIVK